MFFKFLYAMEFAVWVLYGKEYTLTRFVLVTAGSKQRTCEFYILKRFHRGGGQIITDKQTKILCRKRLKTIST